MAEGYAKGLKEGYDKGYSDVMDRFGGEEAIRMSTIDEVLLSSLGTHIMFWVFSAVNMIVLIYVSIYYLLLRVKDLSVRIAKALVYVVSAYLWFRLIQPPLLANYIPGAESAKVVQLLIESVVFVIAFFLCLIFDRLYIKTEPGLVWIDCIGIAFCTGSFLLFLHGSINWQLECIPLMKRDREIPHRRGAEIVEHAASLLNQREEVRLKMQIILCES